jgi:sugar lactone lactonase YvrE
MIDYKTLLNILLVIVIIIGGFFGYFYLKQEPPAMVDAGLPVKVDGPPDFKYNLGDLAKTKGKLFKPLAVDVDDKGRVFVADTGNGLIKVYGPGGKFMFEFGNSKDPNRISGSAGLAVQGDRVYVTDGSNFRVQLYSTDGKFIKTFVSQNADKKVGAMIPVGIDISEQGDVYITDVFYQRVLVFDQNGKFKFQFGTPGSKAGQFQYANDIVVDKKGNIYVADSNNARIQVFDPKGKFLSVLGSKDGVNPQFGLTRGIDIDDSGRVYVVDPFQHKVRVFDNIKKGGIQLFTFADRGIDNGQLYYPNGLAVKKGKVYVTDRENDRIVVYGY